MGYLQLASAVGMAGGTGLGSETGALCVLCFALGLCALGAALRLLWKATHARSAAPPPRLAERLIVAAENERQPR